ncbi:MAG: sugar-transfer associated ATP-grasp domain-containing protein [Crocinitomicaceae bacterium]|nr:sugar-transfer associated ATP-grasp domain-containing protein [Crocinitomicaceae bacterium]
MFKKLKSIQKEFLGLNERNVKYIYPSNKRKDYKLADDKVLAKQIMEEHNIACAKTYAVIENIGEIPAVWNDMNQYRSLAVKPANGSGGGGILILSKSEDGTWMKGKESFTNEQIHLYLANIIMGVYSLGSNDRVLIEECIIPHSFFQSIYDDGVPDFRVIVYKHQIALGMLRVPTDASDGKANLHQGGLGIGVDLSTGQMTDAFDGNSYYDVHPDTLKQIKGIQLPYWDEIIELSLKTAEVFPLKYLGVDIVIDQNKGPLIMEVNVRPGLGIQMVNRKGLSPILKAIDNTIKQAS